MGRHPSFHQKWIYKLWKSFRIMLNKKKWRVWTSHHLYDISSKDSENLGKSLWARRCKMDLWALEPQCIKTSMSVSWKSVRFRKSSRNYEGSGRTGVKTVHCATKKEVSSFTVKKKKPYVNMIPPLSSVDCYSFEMDVWQSRKLFCGQKNKTKPPNKPKCQILTIHGCCTFLSEDEGWGFSALGPREDGVHILVSMELAAYTSCETQTLLYILQKHMLSSRCLFQGLAFILHEVNAKPHTEPLLQQHDFT